MLSSESRAKLVRELVLFGLSGVVQIAADWLVFVALTTAGLSVASANVAGRIVGAVIGYSMNRRLTFAKAGAGRLPDERSTIGRFIIGWITTTAISTFAIYGIDVAFGLRTAQVSKPLVDVAVAAFAFVLSKYWIFR